MFSDAASISGSRGLAWQLNAFGTTPATPLADSRQRAAKRYNRPIIAERGKRLEEIGFSWRLVEQDAWDSMFKRLVQFKKEHGHCNVPQRWPADRKLGRWVNTIRHRTGRLKEHQIEQLESLARISHKLRRETPREAGWGCVGLESWFGQYVSIHPLGVLGDFDIRSGSVNRFDYCGNPHTHSHAK